MGKKNKPSSSHKKKFEIKFDAEARKEFLGGFKKRKDVRRKKAQAQLVDEQRKVKLENRAEKKKYK